MGRLVSAIFIGAFLLAVPASAQEPPPGQTRGLIVERRPADVLEKEAGIGERYALLIGISRYANPAINLSFAAADAEALQKLLLDPEVGGYKPENVRTLLNEQATRKNVMSSLGSWLAGRVTEKDSVVIFYSGHGALGVNTDAYWVTYDADVEDLYASALGNKEISGLIAALPASRKLTLIDSCFSEATAKSFRAVVPGDVFRDFQGRGSVTITASTGQEKSVELNGHGAFTFHLLDALQGKADANANGVVELDEVWNYLSDRVQKTAADGGNRQRPVLLAERLEHGFPLTVNPARAGGATLVELKKLYASGTITVDEIGEAERVFMQREGSPELRKLFRDLAGGVLTPEYFRQLRQLTALQPAAPAAPAAARKLDADVDARRPADAASPDAVKAGETAAYILAESQASEQGWESFIKLYPSSQLAVVAQGRLEAMRKTNREKETALYAAAVKSNRPDDWDRLLKEFPGGRFVEEAVKKKAEADARAEEETTLTAARTRDTLEAWQAYLEKYPNGLSVAEAKKRADQLTWLAAADVVALPAGSFMMGSQKGEGDAKPEHRVEVDAFRIGRSEVSNRLYLKFLEETKRPRPKDPDFAKNYMTTQPDLPVVNVRYGDAAAFCQWFSAKTGLAVRLPTEAEWEYAALGGHDGYLYPWGAAEPKTRARFDGNQPSGVKTVGRDAFPANDFGVRNLAGNVAEWVADFYDEDAYKGGTKKNPTGPRTGSERVIRGGSYDTGDAELRVFDRRKINPEDAKPWLGFRVVVK